jgi:hypothetical protein
MTVVTISQNKALTATIAKQNKDTSSSKKIYKQPSNKLTKAGIDITKTELPSNFTQGAKTVAAQGNEYNR